MMRRRVVLPQPDGPTSAPTSPRASAIAMSRRTSSRSPAAVRYALRRMRTSSRPEPPAGCASFKGLHQENLDGQNHRHEGERVGEDAGHVEQLEGDADLEPDAVRPAEQFDDQ